MFIVYSPRILGFVCLDTTAVYPEGEGLPSRLYTTYY